jgi:23S rRNA (guanosine2251-2'-O)-methyltransferase
MQKSDMIYGTRAVIEAINAGKEIEKIMIQTGLTNDLVRELINKAKHHNLPVAFVPQEKLKRLSSRNHQGVICLLSAVSFGSLENIIHKCFAEGRDPFVVILDRVTDVRNFGAIARTAECAGADALVIAEKGSAPVTSDAMKTSAGALNHIPVCREKDLKKTLEALRNSGIRVVACTEKAKTTLYDATLKGPLAIILGSEEDGISDNLLRDADELVKIPMHGKIGSLNVSVAAGIAIFESIRQNSRVTE